MEPHFCCSHSHTHAPNEHARGGHETAVPAAGEVIRDPEAYLTAKDPVCGMKVGRATAKYLHKHEGEKFYFCSSKGNAHG